MIMPTHIVAAAGVVENDKEEILLVKTYQGGEGIKVVLNKRQIINFLILTFLLTFSLRGIIIIANQFGFFKFGTPFGMLLFVIGSMSPAIVSFVCLKKSGLISSFKEFIKTAFDIRQKPVHYLLVLAFLAIEYIFSALFLGKKSDAAWYMVFLLFVPCIADGGLEELGWRYVLQPTLEKKFTFFVATSITAFIWALWHVPQFFIEGSGQSNMSSFGVFLIMVFGASFMLATIYHISKSIWLCIMCHASFNALSFYWPIVQDFSLTLATTVCLIVISVILVYLYDRTRENEDNKESYTT